MGEPPVVALIGMRGAGKTTLGRGVAQLLGFDFEDLDEAMAAASGGKLPPQIVAESGWEAFRTLEGDTFAAAARAQGVAKVIATGGGIIETERGLGLLRSHRPVIFIDRHIDDVMATLEGNEASQAHRVSLGEPPRDTYRRRLPKYVEAADFRFPIAQGEKDLPSLITALARFVTVALGLALPCTVSDSFFISLTAEDYAPLVDQKVLQLAALDSDVLEFRVDLLKSWEPANVLHQAALIRSGAPGTPMLFTVRSVEHGGKFNGTEDEYFQLNELGLQLCAEFLDVECTWSSQWIAALVARKNHSQLVGSYHNFDRMLDRNELKDVFQQCLLGGAAAIAKVVVKAERREDNWTVQEVGQAVTSTASSKAAFIGLCLGEAGKLSRVLNQVMCPSMHPSLAPGAPGQMSVSELLSTRRSLGLLGSTRQFVVLSPYPGTDAPAARAGAWTARALRSAFQQLKVAHAVVQAPADEVQRVLALASTGGAVVLGAHPSLQLATADWADVSYVDCVAQVRGGVITGHCCKSEPLKERLKTLASKRTALVLGDPAAAAAGLKAAGFQRVAAVAGAPASTAAVEGVEMVEDLVQVKDIDAVVYVGSHTLKSEVTNCLRDRLQSTKPMVVDMSLPMEAPQAADWLVELAEQCGCKVWPADAFFLQEVLAWLRAWHIEAKPELVAQALLGELGRDASTAAIEALAGREAWA